MSDIKEGGAEAVAPENLSTTRTGIMLALAPAVEAAVKAAGLDLTDMNILRRYFRAMVHLGVKRLLDAGIPPEFLIPQMFEVLAHEMEERQRLSAEGNVPPSTMSN